MINWERVARAETHHVRLEILHRLAESPIPHSPKELSVRLELNLGDVSYHVKHLKNAGLIHLVKTEPRRGAVEHFYTIGGER